MALSFMSLSKITEVSVFLFPSFHSSYTRLTENIKNTF